MNVTRLNFSKSPGKGGFTLIELLVVIAIIAILAAILMPVLARARLRALRAQDLNNMKELTTGIFAFSGDNNNRYPPAGWEGGGFQVSWDTLIYSYVGGGSGQAQLALSQGVYANDAADADTLGIAPGLTKIMACPFDTFPKVNWMATASGGELTLAVKDYEMASSGQGQAYYGSLIQVPTSKGLPSPTTPGFLNVGIYWEDPNATAPYWDAPGYAENIVLHPSGTILLAEDACSQNSEGNVWPCCVCGPIIGNGGAWGCLYQMDTLAPQTASALDGTSGLSEGAQLYRAQDNRFSYAFHDGHVQDLRYQQTMNPPGAGAVQNLAIPNGMWNIFTAN